MEYNRFGDGSQGPSYFDTKSKGGGENSPKRRRLGEKQPDQVQGEASKRSREENEYISLSEDSKRKRQESPEAIGSIAEQNHFTDIKQEKEPKFIEVDKKTVDKKQHNIQANIEERIIILIQTHENRQRANQDKKREVTWIKPI